MPKSGIVKKRDGNTMTKKKQAGSKSKSENDERLDRLAEILKKQPPGTADRLLDEAEKEERARKKPH